MKNSTKTLLTLSALAGLSLTTAQAATIGWDGSSTDLGNSNIDASGSSNATSQVWNTTDMTVVAMGDQAAIKAAQSDTADRVRWRYLANDDRMLYNGGNNTATPYEGTSPHATLVAFDASSFASEELSALSANFGNSSANDTTGIRWFVETIGGMYVSDTIFSGTSPSVTDYSLNATTGIEWFAFDGDVNIKGAVGASAGTKTLDEMNFTGVEYVGLYSSSTWTTNSSWHGMDIRNFSATAVAVPEPSSAALLGLGGLALILRRRK